MSALVNSVRRVGLVLAGGGARAAYEVGVVHYLVHDVARASGATFHSTSCAAHPPARSTRSFEPAD